MTPSDSYDPHTWREGDPVSARPRYEGASPAVPQPKAWLPLALSAATLVAGAALAWFTRI